ncbi:hypothetical protein [Saccharopolyspora endophytica]|uniref:2'-5' RNA ligase family protein n=1 Tax=Saccharopolyspora endophytica TaxID=543886 RepID=A0ABS5DQL3_9PSEU|nr:hypothetical protein [Saccharopolyspora endophytica]MBQ0928609.1 hypothetical protein [Saccharopolyspora endophytica]
MQNFFTRHQTATWPEPERLHIYLRSNAELQAVVERYQEELRRSRVAAEHHLGLQDPQFVHFTVQMLSLYRRQLSQSALDGLVDRLESDLAKVKPFALSVGPPQASVHAVELWVDPGADQAWAGLVGMVRGAVAAVLGADAMPPVASNGRPHASLGYGYGDGDSGVIMSTLNAVSPRPGFVEVPVRELELVSVTQHPHRGAFTWETVAVLPVSTFS